MWGKASLKSQSQCNHEQSDFQRVNFDLMILSQSGQSFLYTGGHTWSCLCGMVVAMTMVAVTIGVIFVCHYNLRAPIEAIDNGENAEMV